MSKSNLAHKTFLSILSVTSSCVAPAQVTTPFNANGQNVAIPSGIAVQVPTGAAISATNGGTVSGTDVDAASSRTDNGPVVLASDAGSSVTLSGATTITGNGTGVRMENGGRVNLADGTRITLNGSSNGSAGIVISNTNFGPMASGVVIDFTSANGPHTGNNAWVGASVSNQSSISFDRLTVSSNSTALGFLVQGQSTLTLNNSTLVFNETSAGGTNGDFWPTGGGQGSFTGAAAYVSGQSMLNIHNSTFNVGSFNNTTRWGMYIVSGTLNLTNSTITVDGSNNSRGIEIDANSQGNITNSSITMTGSGAFGLYAADTGASIVGDHLTITMLGTDTSSVTTTGAAVNPGASITLTDSVIDAQGAGAVGMRLGRVAGSVGTATISLSDSTVIGAAAAFRSTISDGRITLTNGSRAIGSGGILLDVTSTGSATLNASGGSILIGDMQAAVQNKATVTLTDHVAWTGAARNIGAVAMNGGSSWRVTGNSDVASLTLNNSALTFNNPLPNGFKTLTVRGDYAGNGAAVMLNTRLGDDNSPTDKLIVQGDTRGDTRLYVVNAGGLGASTSKGIEIVQVQGNSNGVFRLDGRVVAGLYDYRLYQGSTLQPGNGNWYLSSTIPGTGGQPAIRPEPGAYLANMTTASTMFLHTLHDRLGEPQYTDAYRNEDGVPAVWGRIVGGSTDSRTLNLDQRADTALVQIGGDIARWSSNGDDRYHLGLMSAYGHGDIRGKSRITGDRANGEVDGYSVGMYGTWLGNTELRTGPYVDTWAQYARYRNQVAGKALPGETYDSHGWTVSLESGYAFNVHEDEHRRWLLEPQVQIAWNAFSQNGHKEHNGTRVDGGDADGLISRLGGRFYTQDKSSPNARQAFIELNWWYNATNNSLTFNDQRLRDGTPKERFEVKSGLQGEIARGWQMWGHVGMQAGNHHYSRIEGMVSVKHLF